MAKPKTVSQLIKQLQPIFNKFIRLRDKDEPCISCGQHKEQYDAGHFFAVSGYAGLRFDEDNVHKECKGCNCFNESHLIGYADNLKVKLGEEKYIALKQRAIDYKRNGVKWSRIELRELIELYKQKVKDLE